MADPESSNDKAHVPVSQVKPPIKRKSYAHFLVKPLLLLCLLIVIPSFPSKAPEFIHQPILVKFWELLYLSFIGIAVCYGVFSRRNVAMEPENHPNVDDADLYFGDLFGSDEKREVHPWNSQYAGSDSLSGMESVRLGSALRNPRSSISDSGSTPESINGSGSISELQGSFESLGSIKNGNSISELGFVNANFEYMEANVMPSPVPWDLRSGRMGIGEEVGVVSAPSESIPFSFEGFQSEAPKSWSVRPIRPSSSTISSRQEMGSFAPLDSMLVPEDMQFKGIEESESVNHLRSLNFATHSAADFEFPSLEPRFSVPSSAIKLSPYSSVSPELSSSKIEDLEGGEISPYSYVTPELKNSEVEELKEKESSPSSLIMSELSNSKTEELEQKKSSPSSTSEFPEELGKGKTGPYISVFLTSPAMPSSMDGKTDLISNSCQRGYVSSSELNFPSGFCEEKEPGFLKSDMKPEIPVKASSRGKSVRTIRRRKDVARARKSVEIPQDQNDVMFTNTSKEAEVELMMEKVATETGVDSLLGGKQIVDKPVVEAVKSEENFQDQIVSMTRESDDQVEAELMREVGKKVESDHLLVGVIEQNVDNLVVKDRRLMDISREQKDDKVRKRHNKAEVRKTGRKSRGHDNQSTGGGRQNSDKSMGGPKRTVQKYQIGSKKGSSESEECSNVKDGNGRESSKEVEDDAEVGTNEIDKKAGEFISKFKEQMRVEKVPRNEVDTKAGEFIAKFKEQIRLEKNSKRSH